MIKKSSAQLSKPLNHISAQVETKSEDNRQDSLNVPSVSDESAEAETPDNRQRNLCQNFEKISEVSNEQDVPSTLMVGRQNIRLQKCPVGSSSYKNDEPEALNVNNVQIDVPIEEDIQVKAPEVIEFEQNQNYLKVDMEKFENEQEAYENRTKKVFNLICLSIMLIVAVLNVLAYYFESNNIYNVVGISFGLLVCIVFSCFKNQYTLVFITIILTLMHPAFAINTSFDYMKISQTVHLLQMSILVIHGRFQSICQTAYLLIILAICDSHYIWAQNDEQLVIDHTTIVEYVMISAILIIFSATNGKIVLKGEQITEKKTAQIGTQTRNYRMSNQIKHIMSQEFSPYKRQSSVKEALPSSRGSQSLAQEIDISGVNDILFDNFVQNGFIAKITTKDETRAQVKRYSTDYLQVQTNSKSFKSYCQRKIDIELKNISQSLVEKNISQLQSRGSQHFRKSPFTLNEKQRNSINLDEKLLSILEKKQYQPYFISNNTIIQYSDSADSEINHSILDIIETFHLQKKLQSKLYFKVNPQEFEEKDEESSLSDDISISDKSQKSQQFLDPKYNQKDESNVSDQESSNSRRLKRENNFLYFEIELKVIFQDPFQKDSAFTLFVIRDISNIIKYQQKLSDSMYLDAIEANYSHEQMTPLNSILANSSIVYKRIKEIFQQQELALHNHGKLEETTQLTKKNDETLRLLKNIQQSGQIMYYYNKNQIQRMKITKKEFIKKITKSDDVNSFVEKVVYQFEPQISSRSLKVFIYWKHGQNFTSIKADWENFQLILFNIVQNGVKFNMYSGQLLVVLTCLPIREDKKTNSPNRDTAFKKFVLEVDVIDTGIGISQERQEMLFIPFMELKMKQNLKQVKDNSIGMGLACSHSICCELGGDLKIKESKRGLTVFGFKLPVHACYKMRPEEKKIPDQNIKYTDFFPEIKKYVEINKFNLKKMYRIDFSEISRNQEMIEKNQKQRNMMRLSSKAGQMQRSKARKLSNQHEEKIDPFRLEKSSEHNSNDENILKVPLKAPGRKRMGSVAGLPMLNASNLLKYINNGGNHTGNSDVDANDPLSNESGLLGPVDLKGSIKEEQINGIINDVEEERKSNDQIQPKKQRSPIVQNCIDESKEASFLSLNNRVPQLNESVKNNSKKSSQFSKPGAERLEEEDKVSFQEEEEEKKEEEKKVPSNKIEQNKTNKKGNLKIAQIEKSLQELKTLKKVKEEELSAEQKKQLAHKLMLSNQQYCVAKKLDQRRQKVNQNGSNPNYLLDSSDFSEEDAEHVESKESEVEDIDVMNVNGSIKRAVEQSSGLISQMEDDSEDFGSECMLPLSKQKQIKDKKQQQKVKQQQQVEEEKVPAAPQQKQCDCKPRILVVDDTAFNIIPVKMLLHENFQLGIDEASNGLIALQMYERALAKPCRCPDRAYRLIFMDLQMPVMGGVEASRKILSLARQHNQRQSCLNSQSLKKWLDKKQIKTIKDAMQNSINQSNEENKQNEKKKVHRRISCLIEEEKQQEAIRQALSSVASSEQQQEMTYIVALTSFTNSSIKQECFDVGIKKVLNKPITLPILNDIMWQYFFLSPDENDEGSNL